MKLDDLTSRITSLTQDVEFTYNGKDYLVIPFNQKKFILVETPDKKDIECSSIDMLLNTPFFDGKPLTKIIDFVELI